MPTDGACLIIVPQDQADRCARLMARFAGDARVQVRLDARHGDRAATGVELFAVGGGDLNPTLETWVEEQMAALDRA